MMMIEKEKKQIAKWWLLKWEKCEKKMKENEKIINETIRETTINSNSNWRRLTCL